MGFSAATTLQSKWPLFVKYGATKSCVYREMAGSTYSGGNVSKAIISSTNLEIIFDKVVASLVDGSTILVIDRVAIFPALNLPVVPKINDVIVDPSLREWEVKDVVEDPVDAHFELRVRPVAPSVSYRAVPTLNGTSDFGTLDSEIVLSGDFEIHNNIVVDNVTSYPALMAGSGSSSRTLTTALQLRFAVAGYVTFSFGYTLQSGDYLSYKAYRVGDDLFLNIDINNGDFVSESIAGNVQTTEDFKISQIANGGGLAKLEGQMWNTRLKDNTKDILFPIDEGEGKYSADTENDHLITWTIYDESLFWANTVAE